MTEFIGTYDSFYKFFSGYARNKTLSLMKGHKSGVCANCGRADKEIHSAHKKGFERAELVRKLFDEAILNVTEGTYTIDVDTFDKKFIDFTQNILNFHFLCEDCHTKYDREEIEEKDFKYKNDSIKKRKSRKSQ